VVELAPRMRAPLLVFHDRGDTEVPFTDGAALAQLWPNARLEPTTQLGHQRILRDRDVVARTVAFLLEGSGLQARPPETSCPHGRPPRFCASCALERELFDREARRHGRAA
jgi:hypothetical protein